MLSNLLALLFLLKLVKKSLLFAPKKIVYYTDVLLSYEIYSSLCLSYQSNKERCFCAYFCQVGPPRLLSLASAEKLVLSVFLKDTATHYRIGDRTFCINRQTFNYLNKPSVYSLSIQQLMMFR